MSWPEQFLPVRMVRFALVAPEELARDALVAVAEAGVAELDGVPVDAGQPSSIEAGRLHARLEGGAVTQVRLARHRPDIETLLSDHDLDLLAGEAELEERLGQAVRRHGVAAWAGWTSASGLKNLAARLEAVGAAPVPLAMPRGVQPPTLLRPNSAGRQFDVLVDTYAPVPYSDTDPSLLAGLAYVFMFGMMFGDLADGAILLAAALLVRQGRIARLAPLKRVWVFLAGAGLASMFFGLLFGEFFGPTGILPVLWLAPLDSPVPLLLAALAVGAVLLACAYAVGTWNRYHEGGWSYALYAGSGIAGSMLFAGLGVGVAGVYFHVDPLIALGAVVVAVGAVLAFVGLLTTAGGGATGVTQAAVELFDLVIRLGANLVSFARLAAFGLTHAALASVVWKGTVALWKPGPSAIAAALLFVVGTVVGFALEALVAGVQALRLEYYELFSRVFVTEGRPFRPWRLPVVANDEDPAEVAHEFMA